MNLFSKIVNNEPIFKNRQKQKNRKKKYEFIMKT